MPGSEPFLRAFHAANAGITSRVLARGDSYRRLAALVPTGARVLDLGCGDGHLLSLLGPRAVGLDMSPDELALARARGRGPCVQGRAQLLPFADGAFDACVSHLAFMLMDEPEQVVAELARVIGPGGAFHAVIGGGPTAEGSDAFHRFLALSRPQGHRLGDPRTKSEGGWRALFVGWDVEMERWPIDLSGPFDEVYELLASGYQAHDDVREVLRAEFGDHAPCTFVVFRASAIRR